MSAKPFDIGPVMERLQDVSMLRKVGTLAEYESIRALRDFPAPCAYVVLATEKPVQTKTGISMPGKQNALGQVVIVGFAVAMAFRNFRGLEGKELRDELREVVGAVRNPLLGWTPPVDGGRQCQLISGDIEDYDAGMALWVDKWQTTHIIKPEIAA